jgi:hypothetical protein
MTKDKVTNITVAEAQKKAEENKWQDNPDLRDYEFVNPLTNEKQSMPRHLIRTRMAQWTHFIAAEIDRLHKVHEKCLEIGSVIDKEVDKEKEEAVIKEKEKESKNGK